MAETSRERVLKAFNHEQPERVPVDLGSNRATSINAIAYHRLRKFLGLPDKPIRVYDVVQHLAIVDDDVLERFGVDLIDIGRAFMMTSSHRYTISLPKFLLKTSLRCSMQ